MVVFGFVQFQQHAHMLKTVIDALNDALFEIIHALDGRSDGFIDAFVCVNHGSDRSDQSEYWKYNGNRQCQNLCISQLIFLNGIASRLLPL